MAAAGFVNIVLSAEQRAAASGAGAGDAAAPLEALDLVIAELGGGGAASRRELARVAPAPG